jgi:ornithine carbamoyltransferase
MGDEDYDRRIAVFEPYQVDAALMAQAAPEAVFMHNLPAHRGEEVDDEVIDGPRSLVWDQVENRIHMQKAILLWCWELLA